MHSDCLPISKPTTAVDSSGEPSRVVAEILRRGIVSAVAGHAHLVVEEPKS